MALFCLTLTGQCQTEISSLTRPGTIRRVFSPAQLHEEVSFDQTGLLCLDISDQRGRVDNTLTGLLKHPDRHRCSCCQKAPTLGKAPRLFHAIPTLAGKYELYYDRTLGRTTFEAMLSFLARSYIVIILLQLYLREYLKDLNTRVILDTKKDTSNVQESGVSSIFLNTASRSERAVCHCQIRRHEGIHQLECGSTGQSGDVQVNIPSTVGFLAASNVGRIKPIAA